MPRLLTLLIVLLALGPAACRQVDEPAAPPPAEPPAPAAPAYAVGDTVVVTGRLVDVQCRALRAAGQARDCDGAYARQGYPVAVQPPGEAPAWILVAVPQVLADYVAGTVRVTGRVRSEGVLIPHRVELRTEETWTYIM